MGYYTGDFYGGARGDPGIGSFFGGLVKSAVGFIPGVGGALSNIITKVTGPGRIAGGAATAGRIIQAGKGVIMKHPALSAAGAAGAIALAGAGAHKMLGGGGECPKGFHLDKKHHAKCVRNRHMNPCNPRALRRAIRRAHSFTRLAMHTIHLTHPKKKGRFGGFKKRKRK